MTTNAPPTSNLPNFTRFGNAIAFGSATFGWPPSQCRRRFLEKQRRFLLLLGGKAGMREDKNPFPPALRLAAAQLFLPITAINQSVSKYRADIAILIPSPPLGERVRVRGFPALCQFPPVAGINGNQLHPLPNRHFSRVFPLIPAFSRLRWKKIFGILSLAAPETTITKLRYRVAHPCPGVHIRSL
jgi:hypothetical protein